MANSTTQNTVNDSEDTNTWEELALAVTEAIAAGKLPDAEKSALLALEIAETLPPDDRRLGITLELLSEIYYFTRQFSHGFTTLIRLAELYKRNLGENHIDTATVLLNAAMLYHSCGRYSKADVHYRKAIYIATQVLGSEDQQVKSMLAQYNRLLSDSGRLKQPAKAPESDTKLRRTGQFEIVNIDETRRLGQQ